MQTPSWIRLFAAFVLSALLIPVINCATHVTQRQGVRAAVSVHAVIAAVDDTEWALFKAGQIPQAAHDLANSQIVKALNAGKAFDASVRAWPADGAITKANLQEITDAFSTLASQVGAFAPGEAQSKLQTGIIAAQQAIVVAVALLL